MNFRKLGLFLVIATVALFSACSDDDDDKGPADDLAVTVEGSYYGPLSVTVGGETADPSYRFISLKATAKNEIALELKDFSFEGANVGDIKLDKISLDGQKGDVVLKEKEQNISLTLGTQPITAAVTIKNSTVKDKELTINLDIVATGLNITVVFKGNLIAETESTVYDMEEWVEEVENGEAEGLIVPTPVNLWGSSNPGAYLLKSMGKTDRLCITKSEDVKNGKSAARIETLDTEGGEFFKIKIPKVTSGSLFFGTFDINKAMGKEGTLAGTEFGVPFDQKPLALSGYFKYKSGAIFYRVGEDGDVVNPIAEDGTKDKCSINAILYEISSDDDVYITGNNTYNDPKIVAKAMFTSGDTDGYQPFSVNFDYVKAYDKSKKYRFAIIASSSSEGDTFSGAPGSVLYLDDIEVVSEK